MKKTDWQNILYDVSVNIKNDVTGFLSYMFSVSIQIALLYYIMKILGEFALFVFEKNGIIEQSHLDIIPLLLWAFGMLYIVIKTPYKR